GAHFARRLFEAGAKVAVGDVNEEGLARLADGSHRRRLDVSDERQVVDFVEWAHEAMGGLIALVNNAGIIRDGLLVKKDRNTGEVTTLSREAWDQVIAVNLTGATLMVREVVRKMVQTGTRPGVLVNLSSIARHGNRGHSDYVAAQAAHAANTVPLARELAPYGIRVGAIAPGFIETPMTAGMNPKAREALLGMIPVGRPGQPEDVWLAVKFILECDFFNGRCVDVDGGMAA